MNPKDIETEYLSVKPQNPAVKFRNGNISIQGSSFVYCHPKTDRGPYTSFEVAYLVNDEFAEIPELTAGGSGDEVYGYVPAEKVIKLLIDEGYNKKQILEILPR